MDALAQVLRYIALVSKELKLEDFRAKIREQLPEAEGPVMTIYEQALAEGREQGLQKGLEKGREEGRISLLVKLLTLKFGEVDREHQVRLAAATAEELDRYAERVLSAETLAAVFAAADQSTGG